MRLYKTRHECPECDTEIVVEYEAGRHREDFLRMEDEISCPQGHPVSLRVLEDWMILDEEAYAAYLMDKMEEARESFFQSKSERY